MKNGNHILPCNIANMIRNVLVQNLFTHLLLLAKLLAILQNPNPSWLLPGMPHKSRQKGVKSYHPSGSPSDTAEALRSLLSVFELDRSASECPQCPRVAGSSERSNVGRSTPTCTSSSRFAASLLQCLRAHDVKIHGHECRDNIYM